MSALHVYSYMATGSCRPHKQSNIMKTSAQANITSFTISEKTWPSFAADWGIPASVLLSDFIDRVKGLSDRSYGVVDLGYCSYRIKLPSSASSTIELELKVAELVKLIDFASKTVVVSLPSATSNDRQTAATSTNNRNTKDNKKRDTIMATARETSNIQPANTSESIGNKFDKAKSRAGRLAKEAGHQIAVRQGAKTAKVVISSALPEQQRASFVSATDTTIGDAAFRGLLAMIVPALPGIRDDAKERISDELFVGAMQDVGTEAFEKVTGPLVQALVQIYGRGILTEPETTPRSGLESGNG